LRLSHHLVEKTFTLPPHGWLWIEKELSAPLRHNERKQFKRKHETHEASRSFIDTNGWLGHWLCANFWRNRKGVLGSAEHDRQNDI
jgi:hypothetical protein